jgi:periplasmic protein TonB
VCNGNCVCSFMIVSGCVKKIFGKKDEKFYEVVPCMNLIVKSNTMDISKILHADVLDIIFDGKNKQYGAYELRKTYSRRLTKALLITAGIALLVFLGTAFANAVNRAAKDKLDVQDTQLAEITRDVPPPVVPPLPPPVTPPPPEVNQIRFTPPVIVKDDDVNPDDAIEEIRDDAVISDRTVISDNKDPLVVPPVEEVSTQAVEIPVKKAEDEDKVFTKVEYEAEFPGGADAWKRYLEKNLNANTPIDNGAAEGTYQVIVQFIVSKDGSISNVKALTEHGYGMETEAVKIIAKGPKWKPALQNGQNVNAYRKQPITFLVQEM